MDLNKILDRLRKLLAIAQDERANPHEAATAAAQAETIMRKYQIEHADVLRRDIERGLGEFDEADVRASMKRDDPKRTRVKRLPLWANWIAVRVAVLNDCQVIIATTRDERRDACLRFRGFKTDVMVAAWMYDYLVNALVCGSQTWAAEQPRSRSEADSFRKGFALAVCAKLRSIERARQAEMQVAADSRALVVAKSGAVAKHFGAVEYSKANRLSIKQASAYVAGEQSGSRVDVNVRGVGNNAEAQSKISFQP